MVPVVQAGVYPRSQGVVDQGGDAPCLQLPPGAGGQGANTPHVIPKDPHLHSRLGLLPEDGKDAVPHLPRLQDEIFQQDKFFRSWQLPEHHRQLLLPQGAVVHLGISHRPKAGDVVQIGSLHPQGGPLSQQFLQCAGIRLEK